MGSTDFSFGFIPMKFNGWCLLHEAQTRRRLADDFRLHLCGRLFHFFCKKDG